MSHPIQGQASDGTLVPVKVDSSGSLLIGQSIAGVPVSIDNPLPVTVVASGHLSIIAKGKLTGAGTATRPWSAETTPAYLTLNVDPTASGPVYVGGSDADATHGFPLWPGQPRTALYANPSSVYVYAPGSVVVGWIVER